MDSFDDVKAGKRSLRIRGLEISPPLALAPMVGLSHSAMRSLLMEMGGPGLLFTEMLAVKQLPHENPRISPFLTRSSIEKPLFYQLFISDLQFLGKAVEKLETLSADGIDVNLGCPAPQVRRRGAGGYLAENPSAVKEIIAKLRQCTNLPVTAKIRLGSELNDEKLINLCSILEGEGADMITVHARLHKEKFCRPPRWQHIETVKKHITIPVLANGGIFSVDDAVKCLEISGADGLMIGRGGIENPWLFAELASAVFGVEPEGTPLTHENLYLRFAELLRKRFQPERRLGRLKEFTHYFSKSYSFGHYLASAVQISETLEEAVEKAQGFFSRNQPKTIKS